VIRIKDVGTESCAIEKTESTKANGIMIRDKEKATKGTAMGIRTRETLEKERHMVKEFITGPMAKCTMVNGVEESRKAQACGRESLVTAIWDNGATRKLMAMAFTSGRMVIDMKVAGTCVSNMVKALTCLQMVIVFQAITKMADQVAEEYTNGRTAASTQAISWTE